MKRRAGARSERHTRASRPAAAWALSVAIWALAAAASAQPGDTVVVTPDLLAGSQTLEGWRYRPGDDPAWASPELDDADWESVDPRLTPDAMPAGGWPGIGWFRLQLEVDPGLRGTSFAFEINQEGASEIYLDGRKVAGFGTVGAARAAEEAYWFPDPHFLELEPGRIHRLAVRYSNTTGHHKLGDAGFRFSLRRFAEAVAHRKELILRCASWAWRSTGAGHAPG